MKRQRFLRRVAAVIGWILYCIGWQRIINVTPRREPIVFVVLLACAALALFAGARIWIAHNKRLAARGRRGQMTRYTPALYPRDRLDRKLIFDAELDSAREVTVLITNGIKRYVTAMEPAVDQEMEAAAAAVGKA